MVGYFLSRFGKRNPPSFLKTTKWKDTHKLFFNKLSEARKLFDLIEFSPKHKVPILKIIDRLKDLMVPFRDRMYYTPSMQESYSIKKVLPAMVLELSYKMLNIQ